LLVSVLRLDWYSADLEGEPFSLYSYGNFLKILVFVIAVIKVVSGTELILLGDYSNLNIASLFRNLQSLLRQSK